MQIKLLILLFLLLSLGQKSNKSKDEKAYFYFYKGKSAWQDGNDRQAIHQYLKAIKLDPSNALYFQALIRVYFETGAFEEALEALESHKDIFSTHYDLFIMNFLQGLALACNGDHHKGFLKFLRAEKIGKKLSEKDSTVFSHLYNNLACEKILNQPVEWSPHLEEHPHLTISSYVFPVAYEYCVEALRYNPDNIIALENLEFISQFCNCPSDPINFLINDTLNAGHTPTGNLSKPAKYTSGLSRFNIRFLPDRISKILNVLNKYDELVMLLDISGSMEEEVEINNTVCTRFDVMIDISKYLISCLKQELKVGVLTIGLECEDPPAIDVRTGGKGRANLINAVSLLKPEGYTPLNDRLRNCETLFSDTTEKKAVLLFTDGLNTCGEENTCQIAEDLYSRGINIYILSFLLERDSEMEYSVFDCMANISDGQIYEVEVQNGISDKTISIDPPYYSLVIPVEQIDSSSCLSYKRLSCTVPCNPTFRIED
ncbi:MAG: VWA domain-containing protein [Bacteroidales bacterium]|nr:VWA domain-containing protein [Bacteroidales bacterium]